MRNYEELARQINKCFENKEVIVGEEPCFQSVWVKQNDKFAVTMVTLKGFITINDEGDVLNASADLYKVIKFYETYFEL